MSRKTKQKQRRPADFSIHDLNNQASIIAGHHQAAVAHATALATATGGTPIAPWSLDRAVGQMFKRYRRHIGATSKYTPKADEGTPAGRRRGVI